MGLIQLPASPPRRSFRPVLVVLSLCGMLALAVSSCGMSAMGLLDQLPGSHTFIPAQPAITSGAFINARQQQIFNAYGLYLTHNPKCVAPSNMALPYTVWCATDAQFADFLSRIAPDLAGFNSADTEPSQFFRRLNVTVFVAVSLQLGVEPVGGFALKNCVFCTAPETFVHELGHPLEQQGNFEDWIKPGKDSTAQQQPQPILDWTEELRITPEYLAQGVLNAYSTRNRGEAVAELFSLTRGHVYNAWLSEYTGYAITDRATKAQALAALMANYPLLAHNLGVLEREIARLSE